MKIRKLLAVALTATLLCGTVDVNAYAAENNTAQTVTEVESTEQSANEDTAALENISIIEQDFIEQVLEESKSKLEESVKETEVVEETVKENKTKTETKKAETTTTKTAKTAKTTTAKQTKTTKKKTTTTKTAKAATTKSTKTTAKTTKASYAKDELRLLSALIFCEAGAESYAGKLGVGIVVMNRVESKSFPNTLKNVIYQKYQFGPARNGSLTRALAQYDAGKFTTKNHKESIQAAKAALEGAKSVTYKGKNINMKSTLYFSGRVSGAKFSIGNHQFK